MRVILIFVGVPGLEPGKAGPESAVLPITPYPNLRCKGKRFPSFAVAKVRTFEETAKLFWKKKRQKSAFFVFYLFFC